MQLEQFLNFVAHQFVCNIFKQKYKNATNKSQTNEKLKMKIDRSNTILLWFDFDQRKYLINN